MKRRLLITAALVLGLAALTFQPAPAQGPMKGEPGMRRAAGAQRGAMLEAVLGSGAAAQVRAARLDFFKQTAPLRRQIKLTRAELKVLQLTEGTTAEALLARNRDLQRQLGLFREQAAIHRYELISRHPDLVLLKGRKFHQGKGRHQSRRAGFARQANRGGGQMKAGMGMFSDQIRQEIAQARQEFFKATFDLRREMKLRRAELKVMMLRPDTGRETLVAKVREINALRLKLSEARLNHRLEMKKRFPRTAASDFGSEDEGEPQFDLG